MAYQPLQRPTNITGLLDSGLSLYVSTLRRVIILSIILALLGILPELIFPSQYVAVENGRGIAAESSNWFQTVVGFVLTAANVLLSAAMLVMIYRASDNQEAGYQQAWQVVSKNWLSILLTMAIYAAMLVFGLVLFIVPAVYAYITFMFAVFFVVFYDNGPFAALKNSFYLVQENWWRCMGFITVVSISILAAFIVLLSIFSVGIQPGELYEEQLPFGFYLLVGVLIALVSPLMTAMQVVLYRDLQLRNAEFNIEEL